MRKTATAWEDPAEEVAILFYIGLNPRFGEFVASTPIPPYEPGKPDCINLGGPRQRGIERGSQCQDGIVNPRRLRPIVAVRKVCSTLTHICSASRVQRKEDSTGQSCGPLTPLRRPSVQDRRSAKQHPARIDVLACLCGCRECQWLGGNAPEDRGSGLLNCFQALAQEVSVSVPKLDVVLGRGPVL
jgi:hypothetical protein